MKNEPVAWIDKNTGKPRMEGFIKTDHDIPLYTHPVKELTLSIGEIHAVLAAGKYYELDKDGQVDEIKFTEFAYAILRKAQKND